jgi:hypothetical protein
MFPQVWQQVVRGSYRCAPALLDGYRRFAVRGQTYPGMIAQPGAQVEGLVYFDINAADLVLLDAFEGSDYRRDLLRVTLASGQALTACAYIYTDVAGLSDQPWQPAEFQLQRFLDTYCR